MMKKFWYLVFFDFKKKIKSKTFLITNIFLFLLIFFIANLDSIISFFGGNFDNEINVYVIDDDNRYYDLLEDNYNEFSSIMNINKNIKLIKSDEELSKIKEKIVDTDDIIIEFVSNSENVLNADIITETHIDDNIYQMFVQSINMTKYEKALEESSIDIDELNKISSPADIKKLYLDENKTTSEDEEIIMNFVFPIITMPFFMLLVVLIQLIGGQINEEKTTRSMEIIISNVPAKVHFYSKMISSNLFVILQAVLMFLYGAFSVIISKVFFANNEGMLSDLTSKVFDVLSKSGIVDNLYLIIPILVILIILSFVAYSLVIGILTSMTVNPEDFQTIQTPVLILVFVSYYLAMMANTFDGSLFIKVLSYIPLISYLLSPSLLLIGQITIVDSLISVVVLLIFNIFVTKYGLKIYKVGVLNYSTDKLWKRIFKAGKM